MQKLEKKYGLLSAVCMVTGSVIGSGIFFKAELISRVTGADARIGSIAWIVGGCVMLSCLLVFSFLAQKHEDASGLSDYCGILVGKRYGYFVGWFMATVYFPTLVSVLAWLSARYTLLCLGHTEQDGGLCMLLASVYLALSYCQNILFPSFSGKLQVITTFIKLIPLALMIIFGTAKGIDSGMLSTNFSVYGNQGALGFFSAVVSSLFAYEGWIGAASIGAELKNSKKNLPRALLLGGSIVTAVYLLYFIGISGAVNSHIFLNHPGEGIRIAFSNALGENFASALTAFVAVSCFGALNATMFCSVRAMYSVAKTGQGPLPRLFSQIDSESGMPSSSGVAGLGASMAWLFFYYGAKISPTPLFSGYGFDSSELPIVSIYAMYIPLFLMYIRKSSDGYMKRFLLAPLAVISCLFMVFCAVYSHRAEIINYLAAFTAIMLFGAVFEKK